ncbi:putative mitochondrial protein AtMg00860 [Bidens hawaiensis]|uniref:putative mitochondrial protein AtMg00860 n=1 Tax=Bidens hawaiensis TaxID=980011 RepID=UPI00404B7982
MLRDIEETFETLKQINMKLNPAKCSFGMEEGKYLGVIVTGAGFKANPDKVQAVACIPSSSSLKELQTLNGRLVALNRFLANHVAKSYPFVSTLRNCLKKAHFKWTAEVE